MKREELKTYTSCEMYNGKTGKFQTGVVILKEEADSVMDAMERRIARLAALVEGFKKNSLILGEMYHKRLAQEQARIKALEEENKHLEDYIDVYQKSEAINIAKLDEKDERIKELRESLIANDNHWLGVYHEDIRLKARIRELEAVISKMDTTEKENK